MTTKENIPGKTTEANNLASYVVIETTEARNLFNVTMLDVRKSQDILPPANENRGFAVKSPSQLKTAYKTALQIADGRQSPKD
jgi:hypothetical protein